jgi:hypothetical protein
MPEEEEITIILTPQGTQIVSACTACVLGAKDDRCGPRTMEFVNALIDGGHVTQIKEPKEDPQ